MQVFNNSDKVKETCSQAQHEIALESLIKKVHAATRIFAIV